MQGQIRMLLLHPITPALAMRFKSIRLRALLDTPTAFGSTYAQESPASDADWERRAAGFSGVQSIVFLAIDEEAQQPEAGIAGGFLQEDDPTRAQLFTMWVAPEHRQRGVGKVLVTAVSEWAASRQAKTFCLMVTSNNDTARRFYERLGFAMTGRNEPYPNDAGLIEQEMARAL